MIEEDWVNGSILVITFMHFKKEWEKVLNFKK